MTSPTLSRPLVSIDLETTGSWVGRDRIIDIGMVRVENGSVREYSSLVNPGMKVPPLIVDITKITDEMLVSAPRFEQIAFDVYDFLGGADFVGFNLNRFDLPLVEWELNHSRKTPVWSFRSHRVFDCMEIYHSQEKRGLAAAYEFYCKKPVPPETQHRGLPDARYSLEILEGQYHAYSGGEPSMDILLTKGYKQDPFFADSDRKFRWFGGELWFTFGKYDGVKSGAKCLRDVCKHDKMYLQWILDNDFSPDTKRVITLALTGEHPLPPAGV